MRTVRKPSSLAARKMRMAISLRLAASSFCMTFVFTIRERPRRYAKPAILTRATRAVATVFETPRLKGGYAGSGSATRGSVQCRCSLGALRLGGEILQFLKVGFDLNPLLVFALGGVRRIGVSVKVQQLRAQPGGHVCKIPGGEFLQQLGVRIVIHAIDPGTGGDADVKIVVEQLQAILADFFQQAAIAVHSGIEAGLKHALGLRRGCFELQNAQRSHLRQNLVEKGEDMIPESRALIVLTPLMFVAGTRQVVEKFLAGDARNILLDFVLLQSPCHAGRAWNQVADIAAVGAEHFVLVGQDAPEVETVGFAKSLFEERGGYLKPDEIVIAIGSVTPLGHFQDIETEFRLDVGQRIIFVGDGIAVLLLELGIKDRDGAIRP